MSSAEDEPPLTVDQLADLQAGLLDDDTAARVPSRIRTDPHAAATLQALHQVRDDLAAAGPSSGAAHAARPPVRPVRAIAGFIGVCAVLAAMGVGTVALLDQPESTPSMGPTVDHITVSTPVPVIPLTDHEIRALLQRSPDFGALGSATQRASCLAGLGYPAAEPVLGAQPVEVNARPGVLLVMRGDTPDTLLAFAVAVNCSAADTGLLATTAIPRS
ncbi:hypothetical protein A5634_17160 [Mycobacterium asiaticum]|uniref:Anti-sigma-M factor RsmA n=1 Tax=Mycobacterium asiaticum TaxID=1790 RepID=A0A1A3P9C5_MYCAS|nr:hypothetical protein [Mycobacterium asiaticum]OBK29909.1 hypothetical protein A5634_17160 [Mycobacterium asiaticum]